MNKASSQKIRIMKVYEILKRESDEEKPISTPELLMKLKKLGIECERKTLYDDIEVLNANGYEVLKGRAKTNNYYIVDRGFDIPELRVLMDATSSASFITEKKTAELLDKVAALGGDYRAKLLKRDSIVFDTMKHTNERIYYNISALDDAIISKKKIEFQYMTFNENGQKKLKHDGANYVASPLVTLFQNGNYYMVAYYEKYRDISNFRVDRMCNVKVLSDDIEQNDKVKNFDTEKHKRVTFGMYTGEEKNVALEFDSSLIDVIFDRFGEKIRISKVGENMCQVTVLVQISDLFFGWCCSFGNKLKLVAPNEVLQELQKYIEELGNNYK